MRTNQPRSARLGRPRPPVRRPRSRPPAPCPPYGRSALPSFARPL